jgi:hypothetical protein
MNTYKAKTLFTGYKLGLKNPSLYVGVPKKYFTGKLIKVENKDKKKLYDIREKVCEETFNDRFRPGMKYTLVYFLWERVKKSEL